MTPPPVRARAAHRRLYGLVGHPVAHSVSPAMHEAGFAATGRPASYLAFDVPPARLAAAVAGLAALGAGGFNVTIPHKEAMLGLVDDLTPLARAAGAVNCVSLRDGRLVGHNTDCGGLLCSLAEEAGFDPRGRRVVILGAGGFARAAAVAVASAGAAQVTLLNRTLERAAAIASHVGGAFGAPVAAVPPGSTVAADALRRADLVIQTTPVGMHPRPVDSPLPPEQLALLPASALLLDAIYNPRETALMAAARARGLAVVGGLGTLVWQGALAWQEWFGQTGPAPVMRAAAVASLEALNPEVS